MSIFILFITLAAEVLNTLSVIISILFPRERIWPPNKRRAWRKPLMFALFMCIAAGIILLGILDWNSFRFPSWARITIGLPAWLSGNLLAAWAVLSLGLQRTSGETGALITSKMHESSNNQQEDK